MQGSLASEFLECYVLKDRGRKNSIITITIIIIRMVTDFHIVIHSKKFSLEEKENEHPDFPWEHAYAVFNSTIFRGIW